MLNIAFGFLIFSATICLVIAIYSYIHRIRANSMIFSIFMLCVTAYIIGFAFEISSTNINQIMICLKIQYLGLSFIPAICILMALQATRINKILIKNIMIFSILLSIVIFLTVNTNDHCHLYYKALSFSKNHSLSITKVTPGYFYYVYILYLDFSIIFISICYFIAFFKVNTELKRQYAILSLGSLAPWLGHIIYITGYSPYGIDSSPFSMMLLSIIYFYGFFYDKSFEFVSIARNRVFDNMKEIVLVVDGRNKIVDFNDSAKEILDSSYEQVIGKNICDFFGHCPDFIDCINEKEIPHIKINFKNKGVKFFQPNISLIKGKKEKLLGKVIVLNDITDKVKLMDKLGLNARFDGLTGLYNRVSFFELLQDMINMHVGNKWISLIILDIDNFKAVNDIYGHQAGDEVLKAFANIIKSSILKDYIAGRYGGEEFVIFISNSSQSIAYDFAEELRKKFEQLEIIYENRKIKATASFGVASELVSNQSSLKAILRKADIALYNAKAGGKNKVKI